MDAITRATETLIMRKDPVIASHAALNYVDAVAIRKIQPFMLLFASLVATFPLSAGVGWKIFWGLLMFVALSYFAQTVTHRRSKRLTRLITVEQAESEHLAIHENHKWRGLLERMRLGDVVWKFVSPAQQRGFDPCDVSIALVSEGKIADSIVVRKGKRESPPFRCGGCGCGRGSGNRRKFKAISSAAN